MDTTDNTIQDPTGPAGPRGPAGPQGVIGFKGEDSIVPGPRGPVGPQGERGPKGDTGPSGSQGEFGPPGSRGSDGKDGQNGNDGLQGPMGPASDLELSTTSPLDIGKRARVGRSSTSARSDHVHEASALDISIEPYKSQLDTTVQQAVNNLVEQMDTKINYNDLVADFGERGSLSMPGGITIQWGSGTSVGGILGNCTGLFDKPFKNKVLIAFAIPDSVGVSPVVMQKNEQTTTRYTFTASNASNGVPLTNINYSWFVLGY